MSDDFFGDLGKSISQVTQQAANKTNIFFESQKISGQISAEQREIEKLYQQIGEEVYKHADACSHMGPKIDADIATLKTRCQKLNDMKKNLASVKGLKVCPNCGETVELSSAFCPKCGTPVPNPEEKKDASGEEAPASDAHAEDNCETMHEEVKEAVDKAKQEVEDETKQ